MANVLGTGPVGFTTAEGKYVFVPLKYLSYDSATGVTIATGAGGWTAPDGKQTTVDAANAWVSYLFNEDELLVDPSPPAPVQAPTGPAFLVEAVHPGLSGTGITLTIGNVVPANPPTDTTFDLTVEAIYTYKNLEVAKLAQQIGATVNDGTEPGLIYLAATAGAGTLPDAQTAAFADSGSSMQAAVKTGGTTTFTLEAPGDGGGGNPFSAEVKNVSDPTFDLTITWKKTSSGKITDHVTALNYVVAISPPPSGQFGAPSGPTTVSLTNGDDKKTTTTNATKASASV